MNPTIASFKRDLHRALVHLYDPGELARSPLVRLFRVEQQTNPASALQRILNEAIAALKPPAGTPPQAVAWRTYRLLFHRYTEQCTQVEVASILALSERQLRREEHAALKALASYLWTQYGLDLYASSPAEPPLPVQAGTPSSREAEMEWLLRSTTGEAADVAEAIEAALKIASPLLERLRVRAEAATAEDLPRVALQPATLRQALLNTIMPAARAAAGSLVCIAAQAQGQWIEVTVQPLKSKGAPAAPSHEDAESLEMARQLAGLAGGTLTVASEAEGFVTRLNLPAAEQVAVLVIDDNADTLHLFQRCLAGTRYPYIGARDPEQALALAEKLRPRIIVLDLMLPGVDGWEVLGRLREHPRTRGIPIVVCSILPQEQLALTLGAAAFIRKPVSRASLLEVLDRLVEQRVSRPH